MKRLFGAFEVIFDVTYLGMAFLIGLQLLRTEPPGVIGAIAGSMAMLLVIGDAFHLIPRILAIVTRKEAAFRSILGRGKQITSITMTLFYFLLWQVGILVFPMGMQEKLGYILYALAAIRIVLCLCPQNRWKDRYPPVSWGILRNIPFFLMGLMVAGIFFRYRLETAGFRWMWLAILLSFLFYLPVVIGANKNPKLGMLMLPKSCMYLWMLGMCLAL